MDPNMSFVLITDSDETSPNRRPMNPFPFTTRSLFPPFTSQRGISSEMKASEVLCVFYKLEMMTGLKAPPTHPPQLEKHTELITKIQIANGSQ